MIWRCDLVPQYERFKDEITKAMERVCMTGRYVLSGEVKAFEEQFARYLGVKHVIGVANGTDALMLIMRAMNIGAGDEVITTAYTAIPTVSAITAMGATPVFVDIDPDTFLLDITKVSQKITPKTKAIMPVHIFGNVLDIAALKKAVGEIPIIEDACQAHGSSIHGHKAGSMGHASAFSFYPTKNVGGYGDGGAIATNDSELADILFKIRMYGMVDKDHIVVNGVNTRLDELQAAILSIKLAALDEMNAQRIRIATRYRSEITLKGITHQAEEATVVPNYHVYAIRYSGNRDKLLAYLESNDIQVNIYYPVPLHLQEANRYLGYKVGDLPNTEKLCDHALAITMYPELEENIVDYVIEKINAFKE